MSVVLILSLMLFLGNKDQSRERVVDWLELASTNLGAIAAGLLTAIAGIAGAFFAARSAIKLSARLEIKREQILRTSIIVRDAWLQTFRDTAALRHNPRAQAPSSPGSSTGLLFRDLFSVRFDIETFLAVYQRIVTVHAELSSLPFADVFPFRGYLLDLSDIESKLRTVLEQQHRVEAAGGAAIIDVSQAETEQARRSALYAYMVIGNSVIDNGTLPAKDLKAVAESVVNSFSAADLEAFFSGFSPPIPLPYFPLYLECETLIWKNFGISPLEQLLRNLSDMLASVSRNLHADHAVMKRELVYPRDRTWRISL